MIPGDKALRNDGDEYALGRHLDLHVFGDLGEVWEGAARERVGLDHGRDGLLDIDREMGTTFDHDAAKVAVGSPGFDKQSHFGVALDILDLLAAGIGRESNGQVIIDREEHRDCMGKSAPPIRDKGHRMTFAKVVANLVRIHFDIVCSRHGRVSRMGQGCWVPANRLSQSRGIAVGVIKLE